MTSATTPSTGGITISWPMLIMSGLANLLEARIVLMLTEYSAAIERSVSPATTVRVSGWSGAPFAVAVFSAASASATTSAAVSAFPSPSARATIVRRRGVGRLKLIGGAVPDRHGRYQPDRDHQRVEAGAGQVGALVKPRAHGVNAPCP